MRIVYTEFYPSPTENVHFTPANNAQISLHRTACNIQLLSIITCGPSIPDFIYIGKEIQTVGVRINLQNQVEYERH